MIVVERHGIELRAAFVALLLDEVLSRNADAASVDSERGKLYLAHSVRVDSHPLLEKLNMVARLQRQRARLALFAHDGFERLRVVIGVHAGTSLRGS